ncbi:MAG: bifunctional diaminohydroxyphosphoribosylaminopyrimidine deaminase/5-amino-6-(5-phosphoribosylamino)uracil reductase RibD [Pacificimonas sp.]|nr:bifunctional diaminohydroxyphosphoribosylaminopyrimidine deaminase/5-amino-6-(5-phosphoribosylamino)uracil reductase RibD [Pacificimonas sp.]
MSQAQARADRRWMGAALAFAEHSRGLVGTNPFVGCVVEREGRVLARGRTRETGRPHAEADALGSLDEDLTAATIYVTLEPCAHNSQRGPACTDILLTAKPARIVVAALDPDPRTAGQGAKRLRAAGIDVTVGTCEAEARAQQAGFRTRIALGRPRLTLKLATSIDGRVALASGESQWITGEAARAHGHLIRAQSDGILTGRGTWEADSPSLTCRLQGLEDRSPVPLLLSATLTELPAPLISRGGRLLHHTDQLADLAVNDILVEGGAGLAGTMLNADLIDRLLVYRAPVLIGDTAPGAGRIDLPNLAAAHGRWRRTQTRALGEDYLEIYERTR